MTVPLDDLPLIDRAWTNRPPQKIEDAIAFIVREGLPQWRLIRQLFNALIGNLNDGTLQIFGVLIRFGDGVPSSADPNGSFYVRVDPPTATTWLYYRFADAWTLFSGGGAGVTSVTAGAGLVNSGTAANPVIDAVAANATIIVGADNLQVGTISSANVDGSIATAAALASAVATIDAFTVGAGAGMTGGGAISANPTVNVAAADATIVVNADSVQVGVISSANVDDTIVTEGSLVESVDLLGQLVEAAETEVAILISIDANLASHTNTLPVDL